MALCASNEALWPACSTSKYRNSDCQAIEQRIRRSRPVVCRSKTVSCLNLFLVKNQRCCRSAWAFNIQWYGHYTIDDVSSRKPRSSKDAILKIQSSF